MAKEFRFRTWFISQLRNISRRYPPHYRAENAVKEEYFITSKTGKKMRRVRFTCVECGLKFSKKLIRRDHIIPVVDPDVGFPVLDNGEDNWNVYISRMFVKEGDIQMMCKGCHDAKSKSENKDRKELTKVKK